jgi:hypothetical protein
MAMHEAVSTAVAGVMCNAQSRWCSSRDTRVGRRPTSPVCQATTAAVLLYTLLSPDMPRSSLLLLLLLLLS